MKSFLVVLLIATGSLAQTNSPRRTFKSSDGTFMFRYPQSLILCQPQYEKPTPDDDTSRENSEPRVSSWEPDSCTDYMPICPTSEITSTENGPLHSEGLVCIAYPSSAYQGTSFTGGTFSVSEVVEVTTESDCLQFDLSADPKKAHWEKIGGIKFRVNDGASVGMGHGLSEDIYLTFHKGKCYDIEIRMAVLTGTGFDPETYEKMQFKDYDAVERQFKSVLRSFRFLR